MNRSFHHILKLYIALALGIPIAGSCTFGDDLNRCPYNARMDYWYAGSGVENMLPVYVDNLQQYLFDDAGKLLSVTTLRKDSVTSWQGSLPDGEYTFVVWGNLHEGGKENIEHGEDNENKKENEEDMTEQENRNMSSMTLSAAVDGTPPAYRENTDRLYYGISTVRLEGGKNRRNRIYLSHAHATLAVTVIWRTEEQPQAGTYRMRLKGIPSLYGFTGGTQEAVPSGDGIYTLPRIDRPVTYHETRASLNYENEVIGQFVTFRYTSATHPLWSLWRDGKQVIKDLDLYLFFHKLPMNMDTNMEQEFDLIVTVYDDRVVVSQASTTDWDEGGAIG